MLNVVCVTYGLLWSFLLCYFSTLTSQSISSFGDVVYSSNWHMLRSSDKKLLVLIIARSQKPILFTGLKLVPCTLNVFASVN